MGITPLLESAPRILAHVRGTMPPAETAFWERVRFALREAGHELLLIAYYWVQEPCDVPILRTRHGLAKVVPPDGHGWDAWFPATPALDPAPFLEAETLWNGPATDAADEARRTAALAHFIDFYSAALRQGRPVCCLIWNGRHAQEMILEALCRRAGCPVLYLERGPFPGTLHVDAEGILAASSVARAASWDWHDAAERDAWRARYDAVEQAWRVGETTWWTQPARKDPEVLRRRLGIHKDEQVVLFAGQVDRDAQQIFFSPQFGNNLEAFRWFQGALPADRRVFVLGKHHPMSPTKAEAYRAVLTRRGAWTTDVALVDALALADRVAAVNSTVLVEALMAGKPVIQLGQGVLGGKGIAYEIEDKARGTDAVKAWLDAADFDTRRERWHDFAAHLLARHLYDMDPEAEDAGRHGARAMATRLVAATAQHADCDALPEGGRFLDAVGHWDDCRGRIKEHEGFKEVLRGLNIALRASLGRAFPGVYRRLVALGDAAYDRATREEE